MPDTRPLIRPPHIVVRLREQDWQDLDKLVELTGLMSRSEAIRQAVRKHLEREQLNRSLRREP